jgi:hypothetical protein
VLGEAAGAAAQVGVTMQPDGSAGTKAVISLSAADAGAKADLEQRIRNVMSSYSTAYAIEWTS